MMIKKQNFSLFITLTATLLVLLIPLVTMHFSEEVEWKVMDFLLAGALIFSTGMAISFILRKAKTRRSRLILIALALLVLLLLWVEMAVGIFGSPIAGN